MLEDGEAVRPGRPAWPVRQELDPPDEAGQLVAYLPEHRAVGLLECGHGLLVGLLALRSACPGDKGPDRGLSRLDLPVVAVLQHLNPLDSARGEGRLHPLLDAVSHCLIHVIL